MVSCIFYFIPITKHNSFWHIIIWIQHAHLFHSRERDVHAESIHPEDKKQTKIANKLSKKERQVPIFHLSEIFLGSYFKFQAIKSHNSSKFDPYSLTFVTGSAKTRHNHTSQNFQY